MLYQIGLGLILLCIFLLGNFASAAGVVISFEDVSTSGPGESGQVDVFHQYADKGINFNDPVALDYSKGDAPWRYQGFAHSGTKAIEQCYGKESCSTPIVMNFTTPQKRVKVWMGYSTNLSKQKMVILSTFDSAGVQIEQKTATFPPSTNPIPIQTPLEVVSDSQNIYRATVSFAPDAYGKVYNNNLAVDDIEFDTQPRRLVGRNCPTTTSPIVMLAQPTSGQIVRSNSFSVQGTVNTAAPLEEATLTISGSNGSNSLDLLSYGMISHDGGTFSAYGIQDLLFLGSNTVTVRVKNCKGSGESSTTLTYQLCDSTTSPRVTIIEPNPSAPNNIVSSDSFNLKGKIDSTAKLESDVTVTVTAGLPNPESNQFIINPDNEGAFEVMLSSENLFEGNNTITVTAQNSNDCSGEASTKVVFEKRILRRISGESYLRFAQGDPQDKYRADNGLLHVTHDPGCGLSGNNGNDEFFTTLHDLPFWATLEKVEFEQFWPKERKLSGCGITAWFGAGSYLTNLTRVDRREPSNKPQETVHWENACCGEYGGKNIEYVISFIISVPEDLVQAGVSLGEPMFDPNQTPLSSIQPPNGFALNQQPLPTGPSPNPSGPGKLNVTVSFDSAGTEPSPVKAWAQGTGPTTGTGGDASFNISDTQEVRGGVGIVNLSKDNLRPGTWSICVRSSVTGILGGTPCKIDLPDGKTKLDGNACSAYVPGTVKFDYSGGTGLKCTTSSY